MDGYVKLWRCSMGGPIFQNERLWRVWCWCLMKASYKEHSQLVGLQRIDLKPGQFIFGREKAAKELKLSPSAVWRAMNFLKTNSSIDIQANNKFSLVTVVNWELYQTVPENTDSYPDSKPDNSRTGRGQQADRSRTQTRKGNNGSKDKKEKEQEQEAGNLKGLTPQEIWENDQMNRFEKAKQLAVPDCPKCNGLGIIEYKPEEGSGLPVIKVSCSCWYKNDKYK